MAEKLIASFQVDHTRLKPGIYVSRRDRVGGAWVTTFDIRLKRPNVEPPVDQRAMHTIEHVVATYLRSSSFRRQVVYWGPMGCLTGCYFITASAEAITPADIAPLVRRAFRHLADFHGAVPGAKKANCGNAKLHDLRAAKREAKAFLAEEWAFSYPKGRFHG